MPVSSGCPRRSFCRDMPRRTSPSAKPREACTTSRPVLQQMRATRRIYIEPGRQTSRASWSCRIRQRSSGATSSIRSSGCDGPAGPSTRIRTPTWLTNAAGWAPALGLTAATVRAPPLREYVDWRPFEYYTCRMTVTGRLGMMSPRPAIETVDFFSIEGGGTRLEHRLKVENRKGPGFLFYRASKLFLGAGARFAITSLRAIMDEDAAVEADTAAQAIAQSEREDRT